MHPFRFVINAVVIGLMIKCRILEVSGRKAPEHQTFKSTRDAKDLATLVRREKYHKVDTHVHAKSSLFARELDEGLQRDLLSSANGCKSGVKDTTAIAECREANGNREFMTDGEKCTYTCKQKNGGFTGKCLCDIPPTKENPNPPAGCHIVNHQNLTEILCVDSQCFPASASVTMSDFSRRAVTELMPGSRLASPVWGEAFLGGHFNEASFMGDMHSQYPGHKEVVMDFVEIAHAQMLNSRPLRITANHLLPVRCGGDAWMLMPASQVQVGDYLLAEVPESRTLVPSAITETKQVTDIGMFAPLTTSGRLLVDGVSVSSYALTDRRQQALWETSPWFREHVSDLWAVMVFPSRVLHSVGLPYMWMHLPSVHTVVNRVLNILLLSASAIL